MSQRSSAAPLAAALILFALPAAVRAQSTDAARGDRPIQIGFGGGVAVPREGASMRDLEAGMQGQGFVLVRLPAGLPPLRFNVDYARQKFSRPTTVRPGAVLTDTAAAERTALAGVAGMRLDLLHGPVRPYVVAGVGAFSVKDAIDVANGGTQDFSKVNFGVDGGAGLALRLGPISGFVEARLQNVYTKQQGLIDTKSIQSIPVTFGLVF